MNDRLKTIVDLENYPIHDLSSSKIQKLIKKCKDDLDQFSCSTIQNFILPKSITIMNFKLEKKIDKIKLIEAKKLTDEIVQDLNNLDCLIIDSFNNDINEKLFYSILNQSKQLENYILINSVSSIKNIELSLEDLKSRLRSFLFIGIELPTDDLLKVIISKTFSDKQISINPKLSDFIINNVERSYEKMFKFLKDVDQLSLSTGKPININLIKKVLNQ